MSQTDRNSATTTPPSPPPQLQEVVDIAVAAAEAAVNTPVAAPTNAAAAKTVPADADLIPLVDSAASFILKKLTWANLKATLAATLTLLDSTPVVKGSTDGGKQLRFEVDGFTAGATRVLTPPNRDLKLGLLTHGQCRLSKSGANLLLSPADGNKLIINGQLEDVPDAGITLAPPATTLTLYYIYAYMSAGVMALEASTTAYAVEGGTGVVIKSGDATRTLVGMARTVTNAWVDTSTQRFVRSWFKESNVAVRNFFTATRTSTSTSFSEVNSEIRNEFLAWATDMVSFSCSGGLSGSGGGQIMYTSLGLDSTSTASDVMCYLQVAGIAQDVGIAKTVSYTYNTSLTEGYHYATVLVKTSSGTASFIGSSTTGERTSLTTNIRPRG